MSGQRILLVDDEPSVRFGIRKFLARQGFRVEEAASCREALARLSGDWPDAAIIDHRLPDGTALDLLDAVRRGDGPTRVVVMTGHGTIDLAVESMKRGAVNFLTKPVDLATLAALLEDPAPGTLSVPDGTPGGFESQPEDAVDPFLGTSRAIRELKTKARKVCQCDSPALILGETGAGKGVLARWLHAYSRRRNGPFVDLNCGGLNRELLESELFGFKAGAFTGARQDKPGLLETGHGGTVFLDEVGDADLRVQTKLLKVLEERRVRRIGELTDRTIDFRLVAATHWDLPDRIRTGRFRKDLYYRISILPLTIPPLRERPQDISLLAEVLLRRLDAKRRFEIADTALERLMGHPWPGNVRELRNVLRRATLLASGGRIEARDIQFDPAIEGTGSQRNETGTLTLQESEIRHIERVLRQVDGNVSEAAKKLDVPRSSLYQKLKRYGLRPSRSET